VLGGIAARDVVEHLFLVNVDEDVTVDRLPDAGALDLVGLVHRVAVGQDDHGRAVSERPDGLERAWIEPVAKRVLEQVGSDPQELGVPQALEPVSLESAEIVGIAELGPELFEELPITPLALIADDLDEVAFQVLTDSVVVEKGLVDIDQEDQRLE